MAKAKAPKAPKLTLEQRLLLEQLRGAGYAALPEVKFHPERKWRVDVGVTATDVSQEGMLVAVREGWAPVVAVEIDGGAFMQGRHTRGLGVEADNEKIAALAALGWRFIRVTPKQVRNGTALNWIRAAL